MQQVAFFFPFFFFELDEHLIAAVTNAVFQRLLHQQSEKPRCCRSFAPPKASIAFQKGKKLKLIWPGIRFLSQTTLVFRLTSECSV